MKLLLSCALASAAALAAVQPPSPRLLVLNKEEATFAAVDPVSGHVLWSVPTGEGPHELVATPDGKYAFASNYGGQTPGHTISIIDLAAHRELRRIDVAPLVRPHGLAAAGGKLYFTAEGSKTIARYDPDKDRVDWTFETGQNVTHMLLLTKDLKTIFTSNIGSDSVSMIRQGAGGRWTQTVIPVGKGPEGIDLSPDGAQIWSAASRDGTVWILDEASGKPIATIDAGTKRSNRIKLTPDGRYALVSDLDAGDLVVIDAHSRTVVRRLPLGRQPEGILIPPGGNVAYVAVNGDNEIAEIDLRTWQVRTRLQPGRGPDGMAWVAR
jgi:YVTN family beta-propeller protein